MCSAAWNNLKQSAKVVTTSHAPTNFWSEDCSAPCSPSFSSAGLCVLHLTLKRKWFDMIASGEKREEYREMKQYWHQRLQGKRYDVVKFRNGYSKTSPTMTVELLGILIGERGETKWGAPDGRDVYVLRLGEILAHNAKVSRSAPLLAQIGSTDGLVVAVPPAPTFEHGEKT